MAGSLFKLRSNIQFPHLGLSTPVKITVISVTVGVTLIGILARYLRRRRRAPRSSGPLRQPFVAWKSPSGPPSLKSPNGDISHFRRSMSPGHPRGAYLRQGSVSLSGDVCSIVSPNASTSTLTLDATALTPQQLGLMGMEALETAIGYWEDALNAYTPPVPSGTTATLAIPTEEESEFNHHVEKVLESAYSLQTNCEKLFLHQTSVLFRADSCSDKFTDIDRRTVTSISSLDSFVSAQDMIADLREFDEFPDLNLDLHRLALYQTALRQLEEGGIPYRILRTEWLKCQTDIEYLAKIYCVRLAFQHLLEEQKTKDWFADCGRQLVTNLLLHADRDPKEFLVAYDDILEFSKNTDNRFKMEEELKARGVRCMTFYDIVLDFIILDAFEDLENPPSSVVAVVQNRWLSNGFKESALSTAIWSVLKAKRRILKFQDGFIAHFYNISEHMSPVLAWGFLGPEETLKEICYFFKDQIVGFLQDIFNFSKVRYTAVEDLAGDILTLAHERYGQVNQRLME